MKKSMRYMMEIINRSIGKRYRKARFVYYNSAGSVNRSLTNEWVNLLLERMR